MYDLNDAFSRLTITHNDTRKPALPNEGAIDKQAHTLNTKATPLPTKNEIIELARQLGYEQSNKKPPAGRLYFTYSNFRGDSEKEINIHIWFNTKTIMTNINHPVDGRTKMFRKDAYTDLKGLSLYFINPRVHTDFGYSMKENANAICNGCFRRLTRSSFSDIEWRKVGRDGQAITCVDCELDDCIPRFFVPSFRRVQSSKVIQTWVEEGKKQMIPVPEGVAKGLLESKSSRFHNEKKKVSKATDTRKGDYANRKMTIREEDKENWRTK